MNGINKWGINIINIEFIIHRTSYGLCVLMLYPPIKVGSLPQVLEKIKVHNASVSQGLYEEY